MTVRVMKPVMDDFEREVQRACDLIPAIKGLRKPPPSGSGLPEFQLNLVRELALLRCVLAWEVFLEESLLVYVSGGAGLSGNIASTRATVTPSAVARDILLGGREFLEWNSAQAVVRRVKIWISDGEPYAKAFNAFNTAKEIRVVRNRIAHNSGDAQERFAQLRRDRVANAAQRKGMGPGAFLARTHGGMTRFDRYVRDMKTAAETIAENAP